MTKEELKQLRDGLTSQTERNALAVLLNDFFMGAAEMKGNVEVKDIKPTDERNVFFGKLNENFAAFFNPHNEELTYILPTMERSVRVVCMKANMELIIES